MNVHSKKNDNAFFNIFLGVKFKHYFFKRVCNILYNMVRKIGIDGSIKPLNFHEMDTNMCGFLLIGDLI